MSADVRGAHAPPRVAGRALASTVEEKRESKTLCGERLCESFPRGRGKRHPGAGVLPECGAGVVLNGFAPRSRERSYVFRAISDSDSDLIRTRFRFKADSLPI